MFRIVTQRTLVLVASANLGALAPFGVSSQWISASHFSANVASAPFGASSQWIVVPWLIGVLDARSGIEKSHVHRSALADRSVRGTAERERERERERV